MGKSVISAGHLICREIIITSLRELPLKALCFAFVAVECIACLVAVIICIECKLEVSFGAWLLIMCMRVLIESN